MRRQIIVGAFFLVNGFGSAHAMAASFSKAKTAPIIKWLIETGKDREEFNDDSAVLVERKPGEARSKARGAPAKDGGPDRFIHLFLDRSGKAEFLVVQRIERVGIKVHDTGFKVMPNGRVRKAWLFKADVDEKGDAIGSTGEIKDLKLSKSERRVLESDLDFWLARAKQDSQKQTPTP